MMRKAIYFLFLLVFVTRADAAEAVGTGPATTATMVHRVVAPIPLSTGWVEGFLLLIVWLFVAAILIGPLVVFFKLEPRCGQRFSDDPRIRT